MFPYVDEGAMVPTIALFYGQPGGDYGYFEHENTVDEVAIVFGSGATTGRGKAGLVRASARSHGVGNLLSEPDSPESFSLVSVTQRQSTGVPQKEAVAFTCADCSTEVYREEFDSTPPGRGKQKDEVGPVGHLHTIYGSARAALNYNADEKNRTCPKCGNEVRLTQHRTVASLQKTDVASDDVVDDAADETKQEEDEFDEDTDAVTLGPSPKPAIEDEALEGE